MLAFSLFWAPLASEIRTLTQGYAGENDDDEIDERIVGSDGAHRFRRVAEMDGCQINGDIEQLHGRSSHDGQSKTDDLPEKIPVYHVACFVEYAACHASAILEVLMQDATPLRLLDARKEKSLGFPRIDQSIFSTSIGSMLASSFRSSLSLRSFLNWAILISMAKVMTSKNNLKEKVTIIIESRK